MISWSRCGRLWIEAYSNSCSRTRFTRQISPRLNPEMARRVVCNVEVALAKNIGMHG